MNKFTPGPWRFVDVIGGCSVHAGQIELLRYYSPTIVNKANAALMADAPALLDALQTMTQLARIKWGNLDAEVFAEIEKAEAMIAKHRGGA